MPYERGIIGVGNARLSPCGGRARIVKGHEVNNQSTTPDTDNDDHAIAIEFAHRHRLDHEHSRRRLAHKWGFHPFGVGSWRRAHNVVCGTLEGRTITAFDYHYALLSDSVEANGFQRDSFNRFLICVIDLDHAVPPLAAVRSDWFEWHDEELPWPIVEVEHERWSRLFTLVGQNDAFARAVVTDANAARCAEVDVHAEWRFEKDELILWARGARVSELLVQLMQVARPLAEAAEAFPLEATTETQ